MAKRRKAAKKTATKKRARPTQDHTHRCQAQKDCEENIDGEAGETAREARHVFDDALP